METSFGEILGYAVTFIAGGGLMTLVTAKSLKKKAAVEVKTDEIKALRDAVEMVYQPLINTQKDRIQELENEVKSLREQLQKEREARQNEMNLMNKQILQITSALGIQVVSRINNHKKLNAETIEPEK